MQTFLPYADFTQSARVLDRSRLGKQRIEVKQILHVLAGITIGWRNHPAARMWKGYEPCLIEYGIAICTEWRNRGYHDNLLLEIKAWRLVFDGPIHKPGWLGDPDFHRSHRSNLLRKNTDWYRQFDWHEADDLPYVWPRKATIAPGAAL